MSDLLMSAPYAVQLHAGSALLALCLTPVQLWRRGGDRLHKRLGYLWVTAMALAAISSFWVHGMQLLGPFGPIHALSAWVLYTLGTSILAARRGNIPAHRAALQSCAFWGLGVAGLFTLLPGRRMSEALFSGMEWGGFAGASLVLICMTAALRRRQSAQAYAASAARR